MAIFVVFLAMVMTSQLSGAYHVMVFFPAPSKSHYILGSGIVKHLLEAGHEVTFVTPFPSNDSNPKLHEVDIGAKVNLMEKVMNIRSILDKKVQMNNPFEVFKLIKSVVSNTLENPNLAQFLGDTNKKFDLIVAEWIFTDIFSGLGYIYDCPLIWFSTIEPHWGVLRLIDENTHPAYVPDALTNNIPPFNFIQRVMELFIQFFGVAVRALYMENLENSEFERLLGPYINQRGKVIPDFDEIRYNASLVLGNSHVSLGLATRLPQNYKPVGGYHIDEKVKPLPDDLKKVMDSAKNGLIYFSMGSILKSKDIPDEIKKGLLRLFSESKYTVLWKLEEKLPDLPNNVHIVNWAPQQSILAHANCILFISHGGLLSTTEAVHFGKPMIVIPVFADQLNNADRAVKKGFAKRVDLSYDMIPEFNITLQEVLSDQRYTEKARELSLIYHDRPVSPGKELVHWVEHVIRTRGAPHLRSPALGVPLYQKLYLDLLAVVIAVFDVVKIIITRLCCSRKTTSNKKKNN